MNTIEDALILYSLRGMITKPFNNVEKNIFDAIAMVLYDIRGSNSLEDYKPHIILKTFTPCVKKYKYIGFESDTLYIMRSGTCDDAYNSEIKLIIKQLNKKIILPKYITMNIKYFPITTRDIGGGTLVSCELDENGVEKDNLIIEFKYHPIYHLLLIHKSKSLGKIIGSSIYDKNIFRIIFKLTI